MAEVGAISAPKRTQGLRAPVPQGLHQLIVLTGPGFFVSGQMSKQGGDGSVALSKGLDHWP